MSKPKLIAVASAVFTAGIANALVYTLGFLAILLIQFVTKGGGGADLGGALTALIVTLLFTLLLSSIITFVMAFPIALISRAFGFTGRPAFLIAPAIGAALACAIASLLDVELTTYVAIISFAYITAAVMWLLLGRPDAAAGKRLAG